MKMSGAFPVATIAADLSVEQELLEAPSSEPTLPGGFDGPVADYYDVVLARLSLAEQLDDWHARTWRAEA